MRALRYLVANIDNALGTNPFPSLWTGAVRDAGVEVLPFHWRAAIGGRFDAFHAHWPDAVVGRIGSSPRRALRAYGNLAALAWMRLRGAEVAWTVHNVAPHGGHAGPLDRWAMAIFRRLVTQYWVLSSAVLADVGTVDGSRATVRLLRHPAYPRVTVEDRSPVPGRVVSFGEVREYRGYVELCAEFATSQPRTPQKLRIVGAGRGDDYARSLRRVVETTPCAEWRDERLSDAELEHEIQLAEVVVLNYLAVTNSGAALLALSLGRPVVVPDLPVFAELQEEVGAEWVVLRGPDLQADLRRATAAKTTRPDLTARTWSELGRLVRQSVEARGPR